MGNKPKKIVAFNYLTAPFYFPQRSALKAFILNLFRREGKTVERINYIFCSDAYLLDINKRFLNHNDYTDIITFPLSNPGEPIIAEIYISIDRVKENCLEFDTGFLDELLRVIFHGALHLCGFKDKTPEQKKEMRARESFYLKKYVSRKTVSL